MEVLILSGLGSGPLLLSGNRGRIENFAGILGTARRRRMALKSLDKFRATIDTHIITY